jgi:DUF971 family protein
LRVYRRSDSFGRVNRTVPENVVPRAVRRHGRESIEVLWDDGHRSVFPNGYLRASCPCALCRRLRGEQMALPVTNGAQIYPLAIRPVGQYALGIVWSDGHDEGIYRYETLRRLCLCSDCNQGSGRTPC